MRRGDKSFRNEECEIVVVVPSASDGEELVVSTKSVRKVNTIPFIVALF